MTRSFLIGIAAAVASLGSAAAADMPLKAPPPVPYIWTGCYVGANVGGGFGTKTFQDTSDSAIIDPTGPGGRSVDVTTVGVIGGGQVGCDYQFSQNWVIGVQGNFDATSLRGSAVDSFTTGTPYPLTLNANVDSVFAAIARIGYTPVINWLFYLEGGAAWAHDRYSISVANPGGLPIIPAYSSPSETRTGAVVGAGVEWIFWQNWSAFVQWDHYFFGDSSVPFACSGLACGPTIQHVNISQDIDTFRAGVNFRFSAWPGPH